jgi:hypothetical protein
VALVADPGRAAHVARRLLAVDVALLLDAQHQRALRAPGLDRRGRRQERH